MGPQIRASIFKIQNINNLYHEEVNKTTQKSSFGGIQIYIKLLRSLTKLFRIKISEGEHRAKVSHYNNAR